VGWKDWPKYSKVLAVIIIISVIILILPLSTYTFGCVLTNSGYPHGFFCTFLLMYIFGFKIVPVLLLVGAVILWAIKSLSSFRKSKDPIHRRNFVILLFIVFISAFLFVGSLVSGISTNILFAVLILLIFIFFWSFNKSVQS